MCQLTIGIYENIPFSEEAFNYGPINFINKSRSRANSSSSCKTERLNPKPVNFPPASDTGQLSTF